MAYELRALVEGTSGQRTHNTRHQHACAEQFMQTSGLKRGKFGFWRVGSRRNELIRRPCRKISQVNLTYVVWFCQDIHMAEL